MAPVWYQLRSSSGVLTLTGGHDVDAGWVAAVRQPCDGQVRCWLVGLCTLTGSDIKRAPVGTIGLTVATGASMLAGLSSRCWLTLPCAGQPHDPRPAAHHL